MRTRLAVALALAAVARAQEPPRRVASVNLSADEVLSALLPPARLVAVTRWADDPASSNVVGKVPRSATRLQKIDLERLVALSPDLVVVSEYTDADARRVLEDSGIRVHRMRGLASIEGVREAILELGRAVGEETAARRLVRDFDAKLADVARRVAGAPRPRVLYWSGGMTAGAGTAIGSLIECGGGANVGRELGVAGIAPPGAERAFVADPDVVLVTTWPDAAAAVRSHPLLGTLRAVREGRIVAMPNELLVALSQYTADACRDLAARLHPDRFPPRAP
ncbi:MAG TPA: ABC transporter substrate-binding protein [Vicinamibacteria bacterium]|nr:ABC transporter substrate-binding protein [Vicinamibacteria bacterium]